MTNPTLTTELDEANVGDASGFGNESGALGISSIGPNCMLSAVGVGISVVSIVRSGGETANAETRKRKVDIPLNRYSHATLPHTEVYIPPHLKFPAE